MKASGIWILVDKVQPRIVQVESIINIFVNFTFYYEYFLKKDVAGYNPFWSSFHNDQ